MSLLAAACCLQDLGVILRLNPALWNSTEEFPCGPSRHVDEPVCDYMLHGLQVRRRAHPVLGECITWGTLQPVHQLVMHQCSPGAPFWTNCWPQPNLNTVPFVCVQVRDGQILFPMFNGSRLEIPECCPEGVYGMQPEHQCGCTDNKLDSPFRLQMLEPQVAPITNELLFNMRINVTTVDTLFEPSNTVDCSDMDLDKVRLYIRKDYVGQIAKVFVLGIDRTFVYGEDEMQAWVDIMGLAIPTQAAGATLPIQVQMVPGAPDWRSLCPTNPMGTAECEYVFYGEWNLRLLDYDCCAHGLADPDVIPPIPQVDCDTNFLHTPYSVVLDDLQYDSGPDRSTLTFTVNATEMCDAGAANPMSCCDSDLFAILLGMDSSKVIHVNSTPDMRVVANHIAEGVNVTGVFGNSASFQLRVVVQGEQTVDSLSLGQGYPGVGFRYRLYGTADLCEPGSCCPTSFTGLA